MTFDQPLQPGSRDAANWSGRFNNNAITVISVDVLNDQVLIVATPGAADPGPDEVNFAPPPFDIVAVSTGLPAAAFAAFPIT